MIVETVLDGIRYTLSNDNLKTNDEVFPIGRGRVINNKTFILHELDYRDIICGFLIDHML